MAVRRTVGRIKGLGWSGWASCLGAAFALAFLLSAWFVIRGRVVIGSTDTAVNVTRGCVELQRRESSPEGVEQFLFVCRSTVPARWDWWGWRNGELTPGYKVYRFPWWPLVVVLLPARFITWYLAWRMRGRCRKCGYPRLGLASGARCPECGGVPP